jgi:hypothetical protein
MNQRFVLAGLALALGLSLAVPANAQIGPDLVLDDIYAVQKWGQVGDIVGYSIGTEICNLGDETADWIASSTRHPVIAQNIFRLKDDRMEQLGQSWLKHGFASVNGSACGPCQNPGTSSKLGVGCSDPYGSGLNGDQDGSGGVGGLGPRSEVNAATGVFLWPYGDQGMSGDAIYKRIQVHADDVTPALNPGARYFLEGQYVTEDEAAAGNGVNNPSYREVTVNANLEFSLAAPTVPERDALLAWQDIDPSVDIVDAEVEAGSVVRLATKVTDLGDGKWQYEYAMHNINSDRSVQAFSVPVAAGVNITDIGFHDVDSHSGEPYDLTDWPGSATASAVSWTTANFAANPNANALRWGTTYNFRFQADAPPQAVAARAKLFKPGTPAFVNMVTQGPGAAGGGGVPCADISVFQARCQAGNNLQARALLTDSSHDGETMVFEVDGVPQVITVNGDRASLRLTSTPGLHTVSMTDPGSCRPDVQVNCQ